MENKKVGYLLVAISIIIVLIIMLFNSALEEIVNASCSLEGHENCPMYESIDKQTYLSYGIVSIILVIGFLFIFSKPEKEVIVQTVREKPKKKVFDTSSLREEEKQVFNLIQENKAMFQSDLIEKTGFGKAKMTRIIDRLEGQGFVERKRRGMTNVVVLKEWI